MSASRKPRDVASDGGPVVRPPAPHNDFDEWDQLPDLSRLNTPARAPRKTRTNLTIILASLGLLIVLSLLVVLVNSIVDYRLGTIEQLTVERRSSATIPLSENPSRPQDTRQVPEMSSLRKVEAPPPINSAEAANESLNKPSEEPPKSAPITPPPPMAPTASVPAASVNEPLRMPRVTELGKDKYQTTAMSAEDTKKMLSRAAALMREGRIASARSLLELSMRSNDPAVAFALAETYDPAVLAQQKAVGIGGDVGRARALYKIAADAGIAEARVRLDQLSR